MDCRNSDNYKLAENSCRFTEVKCAERRDTDYYCRLPESCVDNCREWKINPAQRLAYTYVPIQKSVMTNIYSPEMGLERGTIFPLLDIPLGVYGFQFTEKEKDER